MMIDLEPMTAEALLAKGISVDAYIRSIILEREDNHAKDMSGAEAAAEFDRILDDFFASNSQPVPGNSLTYSRDDLYLEHD